jgi:hypothetical protein
VAPTIGTKSLPDVLAGLMSPDVVAGSESL